MSYVANDKDDNDNDNDNLTVLKSCHCVVCRVVVRALAASLVWLPLCVKILQLQRVEVAPR